MMQKDRKSVLRSITKLFFMLPVIVLLALIFSCNTQNRQKQNHVAAISPTKMNVLYYGADNPMAIAVSGFSSEEIVVETDNGEIEGEMGNYIIRPGKPGIAKIKVYRAKKGKKELLQESEFRVKTVPDPVAMVAGRKGGEITKAELLEADEVQAVLQNFDFDLTFKVTEFTVLAVVKGFVTPATSNSARFAEKQKDLIRSLKTGAPVYIQDIKAAGPDGKKRDMATLLFKIIE